MPDDATPLAFAGEAEPITDDRPYIEAAEALGCELAAVKAVAEVESRGAAFLPDGRPPILFERHIFSRTTRNVHDAKHSGVSNPSPGGYSGGTAEYDRLAEAIALDRAAALESASWGKFQIMGFNASTCGFRTVEDFVEAMCASEEAQLDAFVAFVKRNGLDRALRARDWAGFARGYNGPSFKKNRYDEKMAAAYRKFSTVEGTGFRVETVRDLQVALNFLGADAGDADGLMGPKTAAAIRRFQGECRLAETGQPSPPLMQAVQAVYYALGGKEARGVV
ncbi:N-acetylmuramidase domain-containing protein [Albimonas sp. CAU 1670]|uniref:N-acetylmuramidase domain-containing protein n=1 Tax=Albimonas sp. CAU 1670 TaxID=3032599 RepID=UPI0023DA9CAF|nr:N-acetylmuramidase domain-containing protein [Albimonas sp. CAU 1670]MDF2232607.1 N-acetylmuramidase domain-containing protein [Albimonas sp. CAU 1670]